LRTARAAGNDVPVLILTARDDPETRAHSLDVGADDCLPKPFEVREVLARIRAVLRRKAGHATSRIGGESLALDLEKRMLYCNGIATMLSAREFALMHAFMERPGAILSRGQLEDRLYGWGKEVESNAVDVLIHTLRKKFGSALIRNIRGLGWTVIPDDAIAA
jgi:two-component system, OmpR family, response regulator